MENSASAKNTKKEKGGKVLPALCHILGLVILLSIIAAALALTLPRALGCQIFNVVSGSMEPAIPAGSVVYVKPAEPETIEEGEVIAFVLDGEVVTHRVTENRRVVGEFVTRGDANNTDDFRTVPYEALIGRMVKHIPVLGSLLALFATPAGKIYALLYAACGVMLELLGSQLKRRNER